MDGGGIAYTCTWYGGSVSRPYFCTFTDTDAISTGDILFQYAEMMTDGVLSQFALCFYDKNTRSQVNKPEIGTWYQKYLRVKANQDGVAKPMLEFSRDTTDSSKDQVVSVKNAMLFNLTKIYGAGNEPTNEEMLAFIAEHGGYIDGTLNLFDAKAMMERQDAIEGRVTDLESGMPEEIEGRLSALEEGQANLPSRKCRNLLYARSKSPFVVTGTGSQNYISGYSYVTTTEGHKYYFGFQATLSGANVANIRGTCIRIPISEAQLDTPYYISGYVDGGVTSIGWRAIYESAEAQNGSTFTAEKFFMCDLTELYGAGNEPPLEYMDAMLNTGNIDFTAEYVELVDDERMNFTAVRELVGAKESVYDYVPYGRPYVRTTELGNVEIGSAPNYAWDTFLLAITSAV